MRTKTVKVWLFTTAMSIGACWSTWAAAQNVAYVVAPVAGLWPTGEEFTQLHKDLASRVSDVPDLETFRAKERWILGWEWSKPDLNFALKARASDVEPLSVGDIVEITHAKPIAWLKSYYEFPKVVKIICKRAAPDFEECKKGVALGPVDENHRPTNW